MYRISFETTNKCNMRCKYCYLDHEYEPLTLDTAMKAFDIFLNMNVDHSDLEISFIGGEPLLYKDNVVEIAEHIKERAKMHNIPVTFVITTNATLLDDRIINFFIKENFSLKISLDGNKEDHDINRLMLNKKSSYEEIMKKVQLLYKYQKETKKLVQISMVISKETYRNVYSNIIHSIKHGFKFICPCLETYAAWTIDELKEIEDQLMRVVDWIINEANQDNYIYLKPLVVEYNKRNIPHDCLYCFPGRNSMHVKTNGDIYACYACQKTPFELGNVKTGIREDRYLVFESYNPSFSSKCFECEIFDLCCAKECVAVNYERTGEMWNVPECFCQQAKMYNRLYEYFIEQKKLYFTK